MRFATRVSTRVPATGQVAAGVRLVSLGGGSSWSWWRISRWRGVSSVVWQTRPASPWRVTRWSRCELAAEVAPGVVGLAFGDPDEQEREPADEDVGADALLEAVEDGAQLEGALEVAEGAFGLEQVLVAERGVLGAEVRVAGGDAGTCRRGAARRRPWRGRSGAGRSGCRGGSGRASGGRAARTRPWSAAGGPCRSSPSAAGDSSRRDLLADPVDLCLPLGLVALRPRPGCGRR